MCELNEKDEMYAFEKLSALGLSFKEISDKLQTEKASKLWEKKAEENDYKKLEEEVEIYLDKLYPNKDFIVHTKNDFKFLSQDQVIYPIPFFYYKGNLDILKNSEGIKISLIGARKSSDDTNKSVVELIKKIKNYSEKHSLNVTIVSGLAQGVDTVALETAIEEGLNVIAFTGIVINEYYPKKNQILQDKIAKNHLLISHVPFYRYKYEHFYEKKLHFVERSSIMAVISDCSIIAQASEVSETRPQARDCVKYGRKLFFLKTCYESGVNWIVKHVDLGEATLLEHSNLEDELKVLHK